MTDFTTAARPYANAVYDIANETGTQDSWSDALANLANVVNDAQMSEMLGDPETGKQQKGELVIQVLGDKLNEQQQNFTKLMAENGRLRIMSDVQQQFEIARAKAENKVEAEVVSAFELTAEQTDELVNTLKNKLGCHPHQQQQYRQRQRRYLNLRPDQCLQYQRQLKMQGYHSPQK